MLEGPGHGVREWGFSRELSRDMDRGRIQHTPDVGWAGVLAPRMQGTEDGHPDGDGWQHLCVNYVLSVDPTVSSPGPGP